MTAPSNVNGRALRAALACSLEPLRAAAVELVLATAKRCESWGEVAKELGVSRRTVERVRKETTRAP